MRVPTEIVSQCGPPTRIYCDSGREFTGQSLALCAYANKIALEFPRPGSPTDNPYIESFNGANQDECLNVYWLADLKDARKSCRLGTPNILRVDLIDLSTTCHLMILRINGQHNVRKSQSPWGNLVGYPQLQNSKSFFEGKSTGFPHKQQPSCFDAES